MSSKTEQFDEYGLPLGVAMFPADEVAQRLNVSPRALKRWRLSKPPKLKAIHPGGPMSSPMYTRAELIRFLAGR